MNAYHYDKDTGFFTGVSQADECQIEKGVFHFAAQSTEHAPPDRTEGKLQWFGPNGWELVDAEPTQVAVIADPSTLTAAELLPTALLMIESAATNARQFVVGDPTKAIEYLLAERDARAFLLDPDGPTPPFVDSWAGFSDMHPKDAAESIVRAADETTSRMAKVRAARFLARYTLTLAADSGATAEEFRAMASDCADTVLASHALHYDQVTDEDDHEHETEEKEST